MAYIKTNWVANETPISPDNMNKIEQGIADAHTGVSNLDSQKISHSLATAVNDFLVASAAGQFVKKTLAEVKIILGLGSAAYTESTAYATSAQGSTADNTATAFATHTAESATTLVKGHVQLATSAETTTGTDASKAVTPAGVKAVADTKLEANYGNIVAKSASFTLALTEKNRVITMTGTSAQTITIPANSTVAFPVGTQITVLVQNTGTVTFAPAAGVTLYSKDTKRIIDGQYASATLVKTAADTWCLIGALK